MKKLNTINHIHIKYYLERVGLGSLVLQLLKKKKKSSGEREGYISNDNMKTSLDFTVFFKIFHVTHIRVFPKKELVSGLG